MSDIEILRSAIDASVNHVRPFNDGGFLESRYVRRTQDYIIVYLSTHSGCRMACRFCHLTATGQTMMTSAGVDDILASAAHVFATYRERVASAVEAPTSRVHFNFMARGEPLLSPLFLDSGRREAMIRGLIALARAHDMTPRLNVSTILPMEFTGRLSEIFSHPSLRLYYSLYSMDAGFRRRWLPRAIPAEEGLCMIAEMQRAIPKPVTIHHALIEGENDGDASMADIRDAIRRHGIAAKFNLVRYNPHDTRHGSEPDDVHIENYTKGLAPAMTEGVRIVPRVGMDVQASCGMFVNGQRSLIDERA